MKPLVVSFCIAVLASLAGAQASPAEGDSKDVLWCLMRGKPCDELDYFKPGRCKDCDMPLVTKAAYEKYFASRAADRKTIGIVLYRGFEVLDVYGPLEMWGNVQDFEIVTVAEQAGLVTSAQGAKTLADHSFADCPKLDILMVPGGMGTLKEVNNETLLAFLRAQQEQVELMTSVCSGSWLLAKAGLLDGKKATSNKLYFGEAVKLSDKVQWIPKARWVEDGKFITSSGVSAGMDMALMVIARLKGEAEAEKVAGWTEYIWNKDPENDPFAK